MGTYVIIAIVIALAAIGGLVYWLVTKKSSPASGNAGDWSDDQKNDVADSLIKSGDPTFLKTCGITNAKAYYRCNIDVLCQKHSVDEVKKILATVKGTEDLLPPDEFLKTLPCMNICAGKKGAWSDIFKGNIKKQLKLHNNLTDAQIMCIITKLEQTFDPSDYFLNMKSTAVNSIIDGCK